MSYRYRQKACILFITNGYFHIHLLSFNVFKELDILVNNAAIHDEGMFTDITVEQMTKVMNINFISPFGLTKEALPHIRKEKGNIIFISSIGGTFNFECNVNVSVCSL